MSDTGVAASTRKHAAVFLPNRWRRLRRGRRPGTMGGGGGSSIRRGPLPIASIVFVATAAAHLKIVMR